MSPTPSRRAAILLTALAWLTVLPAGANAQSRNASTASPFFGQWELDLTRLPGTYGPAPHRVVYDFQAIGDGKWHVTVDITDRDDSVRHMAVSARPDGTMALSEGENGEADSAALMTPTPNVIIINLVRQKMLGSVRTYIVSPDGKEMTESAAAATGEGTPFVRNFHYKRLR